MKSGLQLHASRVNQIELRDGVATISFSHAYVHKSRGTPGRDHGSGWSQQAKLFIADVGELGPLPPLPNSIAEGFLEIGGIRHEVIPLPFKRKVPGTLHLVFEDGTQLQIAGNRPYIDLGGPAIYLEDV